MTTSRDPSLNLERYRDYLRMLVETQTTPELRGSLDLSGIVQQTVWEAHREVVAGNSPEGDNPLPWLRKILAHNLADEIRRVRTQKRAIRREISLQRQLDHSSLRLESLLADSAPHPADRLVQEEQVLALTAAMLKLPDAQRQALILQHWQGLSLQSVAEQMGRTPVAVAGLIKRGLRTLREHFDRTLPKT